MHAVHVHVRTNVFVRTCACTAKKKCICTNAFANTSGLTQTNIWRRISFQGYLLKSSVCFNVIQEGGTNEVEDILILSLSSFM